MSYLKRVLLLISISVFLTQVAHAKPITLKCVAATGEKVADLIIDIDKKEMTWGISKYSIHHVTDTYISAYQTNSGVGGEVWVINRLTGIYKRGSVGFYYYRDQDPNNEGSFDARTYEGRCLKQQF